MSIEEQQDRRNNIVGAAHTAFMALVVIAFLETGTMAQTAYVFIKTNSAFKVGLQATKFSVNEITNGSRLVLMTNYPIGGFTAFSNRLVSLGYSLNGGIKPQPATNKKTIVTTINTTYYITIDQNNGGLCEIRFDNGITRTVFIQNASQTYCEQYHPKNFSQQENYIAFHTARLSRWSNQLDYHNGQAAIAAGGSASYVDAQMAYRSRVNAAISDYNSQMKQLDRYKAQLGTMKATDEAQARPHHHSVRCQAHSVPNAMKVNGTFIEVWELSR